MTETHSHPLDKGSCIKSICQTSSDPLGNLICPGDFPGLYFGQVGQAKWALFVALLIFTHQYKFMNIIILSIDQQFNACMVVNNEHFRTSARTGFLFGPNQCSLSLSLSFFYLNSNQISNSFIFPGINCWGSLASFSKLFGETSFLTMTDIYLAIGSFESRILGRNISAR